MAKRVATFLLFAFLIAGGAWFAVRSVRALLAGQTRAAVVGAVVVGVDLWLLLKLPRALRQSKWEYEIVGSRLHVINDPGAPDIDLDTVMAVIEHKRYGVVMLLNAERKILREIAATNAIIPALKAYRLRQEPPEGTISSTPSPQRGPDSKTADQS